MTERQRYALVGAGHRAEMYIEAIAGPYAEASCLVALCDTNPARAEYYREFVERHGARGPELFLPDQLEEVILRHRIGRVIVSSPDHTHAEYIGRALRAGADVIVEKPLTIDAAGVKTIVEAVRATGRQVVVGFNYRYSPRNFALKDIVQSGRIGSVTSVAFEWVLDTAHGADYFRRWHREKACSGGLLVHKASHHFDLMNWWISGRPVRVFAAGGLRFYGARNAEHRGLSARPPRGTHDGAHGPFELDLRSDDRLRQLYLDAELHDGYLRDRDVFGEGITIEDNASLVVEYDGGVAMSYALNAHSPWEGYRVAINGTEGRAELQVVERSAVLVDDDNALMVDPSASSDAGHLGAVRTVADRLVLQRHWKEAELVQIPADSGAHGGGDAPFLRDIFAGSENDPLGRPASYRDGVWAVAVGIAANRSLETRAAVEIADLGFDVGL